MRKQRTIQERLEQQVFCFSGDPEGKGDNTGGQKVTDQPGSNTRIDSRGNRVNFNVGPATIGEKTAADRVLPNGIVVEDYSRPFAGQVNLSNQPSRFDSSMPDTIRNPEVLAPVTGTTSINPDNFVGQAPLGMNTNLGAFGQEISNFNEAITPGQALREALQTGRVDLGGGFYAGRTPTGAFGLGVERQFAEGGPVTGGIASLIRKA
jgi:hypothetical protein